MGKKPFTKPKNKFLKFRDRYVCTFIEKRKIPVSFEGQGKYILTKLRLYFK